MADTADVIRRAKIVLSEDDVTPLTGKACVHGWDLAVCVMRECRNPYAFEPLIEDMLAVIEQDVGRQIVRELLEQWPEGSVPAGPLCVRAANYINRET